MKKHIPNLLTSTNLFCGVMAILFVIQDRIELTLIALGIALVADFLDGFVARLLGVSSPIGKELDSLADMVSFGVVPGLIMARMVQEAQGLPFPSLEGPYFYGIAFLVTVFSALRLAKFNIDERQSDSFYGVPTPAMTLLIASFWMITSFSPDSMAADWLGNLWLLLGLSLLCSWLLVADVRLIALKFKNYSWKDNAFRFTLLGISVVLGIILQHLAIPLIIFLYIALSIVENVLDKQA